MKTTKQHPSYGMIDISQFTSTGTTFFGSDIVDTGGISITISTADVDRKLNDNWYHSDEQLIRISMSRAQWVDAITTGMNTSGIPCTLERVNGKGIEREKDFVPLNEQFENEFTDKVKSISSNMDEFYDKLQEMSKGKTIKKSEFKELESEFRMIRQNINSNLPFIINQFGKAMTKVGTQVKNSIAGYYESKINQLGLKAMKEEFKIKMLGEK